MKKLCGIFLLFLTVFVMGGCNKSLEVSNNIYDNFVEINDEKDIIYNFDNAIKSLNGFSFEGEVAVKGEEYRFSGKVISRGSIDKSVVIISYNDNNLYINNGEVTIDYNYNGNKVVVEDALINFTNEVIYSLENKGIDCDEDKIYEIISNKTILEASFSELTKWVINDNGNYYLKYDNAIVSLNENYLPDVLNYEGKDFSVGVKFDYGSVSISKPNKLSLFTFNINEVKEILKINYISDLIK